MAKKATTSKKDEQLVINQIIVKAPQRRVYDVGDWRAAIRAADTGRAKPLYDLFEEILIDGTLADAIEKRIEAVLNADLLFIDSNGHLDEELTELINSSAGENMLRAILAQRFYGRSGFEVSFNNGFSCSPIAPKYIDLQTRSILLNDTGDRKVSYEGDSQILVLGKPLNYGLLLKAAPYAIYKRGGFGDYAQWIELFGMPQRIGKYNTYDPGSRALLEEAFKTAGSAPYIVVPKEAEIETHVVSKGSGSSYNEFREACNEEMLITILGQTLTTVQGDRGARSLGEIHLKVEQSKHTGDIRFVQRVLNERVCPMLEARGYNLKGGRFQFPKAAEPLTVADVATLSKLIEIPASFLYQKYGIPEVKKGETIAREQATEVIEVEKKATPKEKTKEKIRTADERNFLQRMWDFFVGAPQAGAMMSGSAPTLKDAKTLDERLIARTPNSKGFEAELFEYLSNNLIKAFREGWGAEEPKMADKASIALQYSIEDDALKTAMEMNLYRFSAAKTLAEIQELNQIFRECSSYEEFEKRASLVCQKFNKQWQRTEYDTALLSAESASRYQQLIRKQKTFPYWKYVTVRDGNVRPAHRKLDGIVLPAGDSRWDKIFPPNDWNCRCRVKPLLKNEFKGSIEEMREKVDTFFKTDEWSSAYANGWGVNRAKQGLVYMENQFYTNLFTKRNQSILNRLNHADYGLPTIEERLNAATVEISIYEGTAEEWYREHNILTDYLGRKIEMPAKSFEKHTRGKYIKEGRVELLNAIIEILRDPDEVWINDYTKELDNVNFIKFYKGRVINVVCRLKDLEYKVYTWFEIYLDSANAKDPRSQYRRGLLVKK